MVNIAAIKLTGLRIQVRVPTLLAHDSLILDGNCTLGLTRDLMGSDQINLQENWGHRFGDRRDLGISVREIFTVFEHIHETNIITEERCISGSVHA